jgi:hypothetical protein
MRIENISVSDLPERFNIKKQAFYNRLQHCGIKPIKIGNKAYINSDQLAVLENLHEHLINGGSMSSLVESSGQSIESSLVESTGQSIESSQLSQLIDLIVKSNHELLLATNKTRSVLANMDELESAASQGWLLTSTQVNQLIGVNPSGDKMSRGSFSFHKCGRIGRETAWKVSKQSI